MKNVKKLIALILALTLTLCFAGCNGANGGTIFVSGSQFGELTEIDAENIAVSLRDEFPDEEISAVEVFVSNTNIMFNGKIIHVFGIRPEYASFLGLEKMEDGAAYFANNPEFNSIELEISVVTEVTEDGITCGDMANMVLNKATGVDAEMLLSVLSKNYFTPSTETDQVCFVTTNTFEKLVDLSVAPGLEYDEAMYSAEKIAGIIVYCKSVNKAEKLLKEFRFFVK